MSLVGPRPPIPAEVEKYEDWHRRRLEVVPGITGLWQVSGRSNLSFDEMVMLDIYYIENWSLGLDLQILVRTGPAVAASAGAF
jgi:lipopolysaccharide/colanic/teichoic acid biosynthesis glycosyltransferase